MAGSAAFGPSTATRRSTRRSSGNAARSLRTNTIAAAAASRSSLATWPAVHCGAATE
jgi:hypothetical protein